MLTPTLRQPLFIQLHREDQAAVRQELVRGLQATPATVSPKYLYDPLGSRLFDAITELPEYYPTRTEAALLAAHGVAIAQQLPRGATLVDLGAGNCEKAARLFGLLEPARYVAVDISIDFLHNALQCMQRQFPALEMMGVGLDFSTRWRCRPQVGAGRACCSTRARASATSRPPRRCTSCARRAPRRRAAACWSGWIW